MLKRVASFLQDDVDDDGSAEECGDGRDRQRVSKCAGDGITDEQQVGTDQSRCGDSDMMIAGSEASAF